MNHMLRELNFFSPSAPVALIYNFSPGSCSKIASKKTLNAFSVLLWHNITGPIREGQQARSLDNRVLFLKVETSKKKCPISKVKSMQNGNKNCSVLLQQKLAMLFIMRSVNSTAMKLSSSNIIFRMISLPITRSALCFAMSDFTGSSDFWIRVSL